MLFDEVLFNKMNTFAKTLCENHNANLPSNYDSLSTFFKILCEGIDKHEISAEIIGYTLFKFVTSEEVRDRGTTGRVFEDLFGAITGAKVRDTEHREDPPCIPEIKAYDKYCSGLDWSYSADFSKNKREKGDHQIKDYVLSFKTLKGKLYDNRGRLIDPKFNGEVNIGSFSYRALFLNILNEPLGDRKAGLGSRTQMKDKISKIIANGKFEEFKKRIELFMSYVYTDDIIVVFKSGYKMNVIMVPATTFRAAIVSTLNENNPVDKFTSIWTRWENNNLRIQWEPLYNQIKKLKLNYSEYDFNLYKIFEDAKFMKLMNDISNDLDSNLDKLLKMSSFAVGGGLTTLEL